MRRWMRWRPGCLPWRVRAVNVMKKIIATALCGLFPWFLPAAMAEGACPVSDKEYLHQITSAADWVDVHAVFKRNFPGCQDDGLYSDGYSNMVVGVLSSNWRDIELLADMSGKDEAFRKFVLRHVDSSAAEADLRKVLSNAESACPATAHQLCEEIAQRCKQALSGKR